MNGGESGRSTRQRGVGLVLKRALDACVAGVALGALSPVMAGVAVAVYFSMGKPVLFRQRRPGKDRAIFVTYKFRTMRDAQDADGRPLPDAERLTAVGRTMRALSLDELPQLFNVLQGAMSLVGPRPLLVRYLDRYSPEQQRRHDVLPGITGWAQINGRNATTWPERFAHDLWYVDNWSLGLDLKILARTVMKVVRPEGIAQPGHETMPEFQGEPQP